MTPLLQSHLSRFASLQRLSISGISLRAQSLASFGPAHPIQRVHLGPYTTQLSAPRRANSASRFTRNGGPSSASPSPPTSSRSSRRGTRATSTPRTLSSSLPTVAPGTRVRTTIYNPEPEGFERWILSAWTHEFSYENYQQLASLARGRGVRLEGSIVASFVVELCFRNQMNHLHKVMWDEADVDWEKCGVDWELEAWVASESGVGFKSVAAQVGGEEKYGAVLGRIETDWMSCRCTRTRSGSRRSRGSRGRCWRRLRLLLNRRWICLDSFIEKITAALSSD